MQIFRKDIRVVRIAKSNSSCQKKKAALEGQPVHKQ
jgi:hypothetical protein